MKFLYQLGFIAVLLLIISCKSPLDKEFDRETAEADFARIVRMGKIDSAEAYIMSHFMVEHQLIGAQVLELDATYADILEESKTFWEKTQAKKEESDEQPSDENLTSDLKVSVIPLGNIEQSPWSHGLKYKLSIDNATGKKINALKGNFNFFDAFGDKVYSIEYKYLDAIAAGEKVEREITLRLQNVAAPHQMLEYGKTNPFKVKWEPLNVLF